uniref:DNA helicase n=1 Tax=Panagrolaimus superbus TaxID=310955 RepID=A0A914YB93_9BILA
MKNLFKNINVFSGYYRLVNKRWISISVKDTPTYDSEIPKGNFWKLRSIPECSSIHVNTVEVLLPQKLKPYKSQLMILDIVTKALNEKQNALIESPTGSGKTLALLASACAWADKKYGRIFYATRTHTQIPQIIKEFARLPYGHESGEKQLRHTILASRNKSCVNDDVKKSADHENTDLIRECKKACDMRSCEYQWKLKDWNSSELRNKIDGIWNTEDIIQTSEDLVICPYYASNDVLMADANIIVTPFNYLTDPIARDSSRINLQNSIVILDEAHNIENVCRNAANFDNCKTKTWDRDEFLKLLNGKDSERIFKKDDPEFNLYLDDFERIRTKKFNQNILPTPDIVLAQKYLYFMKYYQIEENKKFYKYNVTFEPCTVSITKVVKAQYAKKIRPNFEATLNFRCFSPSVAFKDAFSACHSVILASGTLSPTATLKTELGLKFDFEMIGEQCIPKEQIFACVVSSGPSGYQFKCTFDNMKTKKFYIELLKSIRDVCKTVPKGVLVFVSNYHVLDKIRKYMNFQNLKVDIEKHKKIFFEPNQSDDFKEVSDNYTFAIKNSANNMNSVNGAILFGVYRGKFSEGIDFLDDMARCVICVGIPFPNYKNEEVKQKRAFNSLHSSSMKISCGKKWYSIQAYRAVNQALGRGLRHQNDWGAILLFDERFRQQLNPHCPVSERISSWVRPLLRHYDDHPNFINGLAKFIDNRKIAAEIQPLDEDDNPSNTAPSLLPKRRSQ